MFYRNKCARKHQSENFISQVWKTNFDESGTKFKNESVHPHYFIEFVIDYEITVKCIDIGVSYRKVFNLNRFIIETF